MPVIRSCCLMSILVACRPATVAPHAVTSMTPVAQPELGRLRVFQEFFVGSPGGLSEHYVAVVSQDSRREVLSGRLVMTGIELRVPVGDYVIKAWSLVYSDSIAFDQDGNKSAPEARWDCNELVVRVDDSAPTEVVATRRGGECVSALGAAPWTIAFTRGDVASELATSWWISFRPANERRPQLTMQFPAEVTTAYVQQRPRHDGTFRDLHVSASGSAPDDRMRVCAFFSGNCRDLHARPGCEVTLAADQLANAVATGRRFAVVASTVGRHSDGDHGSQLPECDRVALDGSAPSP